jgi:hypothetical protein
LYEKVIESNFHDGFSEGACVMHLGHIAAWGALVAGQLTESHRRYTQMTREHIVFSEKDNRIRVVGGASGILPIAWPEDARRHHDDIAVFQKSFGSALTSALRLGYTFRLGPIGEWIFLGGLNESAFSSPPLSVLAEEWPAPGPELALGGDCALDSDKVGQLTETGVAYRREKNLVNSKRCFMRCYLAAHGAQDELAMSLALGNLATVYLDEGRWSRGLALIKVASLTARSLPQNGQEWIVSLMRHSQSRLEPGTMERFGQLVKEHAVPGVWFSEFLWRLEDLDTLLQAE